MSYTRFDVLTRSLSQSPSRRDVPRGLAGAGFGLGVARLPGSAEARRPLSGSLALQLRCLRGRPLPRPRRRHVQPGDAGVLRSRRAGAGAGQRLPCMCLSAYYGGQQLLRGGAPFLLRVPTRRRLRRTWVPARISLRPHGNEQLRRHLQQRQGLRGAVRRRTTDQVVHVAQQSS